MALLAISTGGFDTKIAIIDVKKNLIIEEKKWQSANDEAEKLMPEIFGMLSKAGLTFDDIKNVMAIKGPGSFTGLRVGVTVANTISFLTESSLYEVDAFTYWWEVLKQNKLENLSMALLVFAGKGGIYLSRSKDEKEDLVPLNEINGYITSHGIKEVFGPIDHEQRAEITAAEYVELTENFGISMLAIFKKKAVPVKIIEPLYIKKPGITERKKS